MRLLGLLAFVVLAGGCTAGANRALYSGTIRVDSAAIGSEVGGRVVAVPITEGTRVQAGAVVVRFDDAAQRAEVNRATADVQRAQAQEDLLRAGARATDLERASAAEAEAQARAARARDTAAAQTAATHSDVRSARSRLQRALAAQTLAERDLDRDRSLVASGDLARAVLDAALSDARQARAETAAARAALVAARHVDAATQHGAGADIAAAQAQVEQAGAARQTLAEGSREQEIRAAAAATRGARAALISARVALERTVVRAPASGIIEDLSLRPGDLIGPDVPVATLSPNTAPYLRVYVPQIRLAAFRLGGHVTVRSDAVPGHTFTGTVEQIDSRAQFTPRNVQTPEDRADVEYGVKIRIADPDRLLHAGTTGEVSP